MVTRRQLKRFTVLAISMLMAVAGCVKVQTGHSAEERRESSAARASALKAEFAGRVRAADPVGKVDLLLSESRFVSDRYQDFGRQFAREWQEAEDGRGESVEAEEMKKMIGLWLDADKPILKAWDDNLEAVLQEIKLTKVFDPQLIESATKLINAQYGLSSATIFPSTTVSEYLADIDDAVRAVEVQSAELERELDSYR